MNAAPSLEVSIVHLLCDVHPQASFPLEVRSTLLLPARYTIVFPPGAFPPLAASPQ